jgi:hypothetical protein
MTPNNIFIEQRIINAIRGLLTGRVTEILRDEEFSTPIIEFGDFGCGYAVAPVITLASCERTEKERIIRLAAYSLTITFSLPDSFEAESQCYAYAGAVCMALKENPTLDGVADRAVVSGEKYTPPKKPHCGEGWGVTISLRVTVEEIKNDG